MKDKKNVTHKVIHTMADGTIQNSIEGYEVPVNEQTLVAYRLLLKWLWERSKKDTL